MTSVPILDVAEDRTQWAVKELRESGDAYWDTSDAREDAKVCLDWWQRKYPGSVYRVVSRRVVVTQWQEDQP